MHTRVIMIEDDAIIREGIASLINNVEGISVVNQYSSYDAAADNLVHDAPDVILLDMELPGKSGMEAIPLIKKKLPAVRILVLTVYDNEQSVFNALSNGADGYLTKNITGAKIAAAIHEVMQGGGPMSAGIARLVIRSFQKTIQSPLSKRETEVLEAVAAGKNRGKIAKDLFIDPETVKTHIKNIYFKLNVNTKEEALEAARKSKLI